MTNKNEHFRQLITTARTALESLLMSLDEDQWQTVVISEGQSWTVLDIVAHVLENEKAMSIHVHKIRKGRETVPAGFDLEEWNAGLKERMPLVSAAALLEGLAEAREKTLEGLSTIEANEWSLEGRHPLRGAISIEQYYETIANHDIWHTNDIKQGLANT